MFKPQIKYTVLAIYTVLVHNNKAKYFYENTITINFPKVDTNSVINIVTSTIKLVCLNLLGRTGNFWGKPEFQPIWWPEESLLIIFRGCLPSLSCRKSLGLFRLAAGRNYP